MFAAWGHSGWCSASLFKVHEGEPLGAQPEWVRTASHCFQRSNGQEGAKHCTGSFTRTMAGSLLPWLQIRRERSSEALSHHCLFRLQLTLLTGLSWPADRVARGSKQLVILPWESFFFFFTVALWTLQHSETSSDQAVTTDCLISAAPQWRLCHLHGDASRLLVLGKILSRHARRW